MQTAYLQSLSLFVANPSPAFSAWAAADSQWLENQDYLTGNGASLPEATRYADAEAAARHNPQR